MSEKQRVQSIGKMTETKLRKIAKGLVEYGDNGLGSKSNDKQKWIQIIRTLSKEEKNQLRSMKEEIRAAKKEPRPKPNVSPVSQRLSSDSAIHKADLLPAIQWIFVPATCLTFIDEQRLQFDPSKTPASEKAVLDRPPPDKPAPSNAAAKGQAPSKPAKSKPGAGKSAIDQAATIKPAPSAKPASKKSAQKSANDQATSPTKRKREDDEPVESHNHTSPKRQKTPPATTSVNINQDKPAMTKASASVPGPIPQPNGAQWPSKGSRLQKSKGLKNPGNLCYRNSILQGLMHVPSFYNFLVDDHSTCVKGSRCTACQLRHLVLGYWTTPAQMPQLDKLILALQNRLRSTSVFRDARFDWRTQQDAPEYYGYLVNAILETDPT